ncbi:MAG TPA: DUF58 domain-containing protein [Longimicrobiales bacterium]
MSERLFDEAFLQRLERLAIIARRASMGQTQGERRSPRRGQSVEFADFRPYVAGDDFRRIDWNAYARLERFFIKLFVEEEDLTVHFLVDASRSMDWGEPNKLRYAARAAGALGYIAMAGLDRVTVTAVGGAAGKGNGNGSAAYFPPHRGKQQALALFDFLQGIRAGEAAPDPARVLSAYAANALRPGPLLLLSDLMDDGWQAGLRALASRGFEVTVVHILSPEEAEPVLEGDFKLLDMEGGAPVEISADYELLARYRRELAAWQEDLRRFCAARQMAYAPLTTRLPLDELLFAWLRRKGVLR